MIIKNPLDCILNLNAESLIWLIEVTGQNIVNFKGDPVSTIKELINTFATFSKCLGLKPNQEKCLKKCDSGSGWHEVYWFV